MAKRFVRKLGKEILKYGEEVTWVLFQYPEAEEVATTLYPKLYDGGLDDFSFEILNTLFHIEKKFGKFGYQNSPTIEWGTEIQIYHSCQGAKKALINRAFNLIFQSK